MLLSLDISLNTGYAYGTEGKISFGTRCFHSFSGDYAVLGRRFSGWLNTILTQVEPTDVVIEKPFFHPKKPGVAEMLHGMVWEAHRAAELRNIPRTMYPPITIKKFITGSGRAKKPEVMTAVRNKGHLITNDHEADAVALLLLHEHREGT